MIDKEVIKGFFVARNIAAILLVFAAGMGMFAIAESYAKPYHPIGKFVHVCYQKYSLLCLPVHVVLWLGTVLFFPVAFMGYIHRFASSSEYYTLAIPYWFIVSCYLVFTYYKRKLSQP
jgi:hypothetical protein